MPEYLAERYEPGTTTADATRSAASLTEAALGLRAEGHAVEFLGMTFVPGDEASLSRFSGSSADLVYAVHERAGVSVERVTESVTVAAPAAPARIAPASDGLPPSAHAAADVDPGGHGSSAASGARAR